MKVSLMWVKLPTGQFKRVYETWDIRSVILFSLLMQVFLIFSAPFRKRTSSWQVLIPMWLAYLLADATANFAIGHMLSGGPGPRPELLAFWAPFLLVHLGGPDTITAFALEDNELWLRHLLQLGFQFGTAVYVFGRTLPQNKLWLPTTLMFIAGLIKYTERTASLLLASSNRLRDSLIAANDPGPSYWKLVDYFISKQKANLPTRPLKIPIPRKPQKPASSLEYWEVVQYAYHFSKSFQGILSDLILSFRVRDESRNFFFNRTARDAFKLVEVELNFYYEALYTKARVVQNKFGICTRSLSFILTLATLLIFIFTGKTSFERSDIGITYTLLYGAIALDIIALIMSLFSDWIVVAITKPNDPTKFNRELRKVLNIERKRRPEQEISKGKKHHRFLSCGPFREILSRRWCETISQYNLINCCLYPRKNNWMEALCSYLGITNFLDSWNFVTKEQFNNDLRDLIFSELKMKAELADDLEITRELYSARGDWVLKLEECPELLPWVSEVEFEESLLLWHIATEICRNCNLTEICRNINKDEDAEIDLAEICRCSKSEGGEIDLFRKREDKNKYRHISKLLSDYMMYLLILKSQFMSTVAGIGQMKFKDTCAHAQIFFQREGVIPNKKRINVLAAVGNWFQCGKRGEHDEDKQEASKRACKSILKVKTDFQPISLKEDKSKSVLFEACKLAKKLEEVGKTKTNGR